MVNSEAIVQKSLENNPPVVELLWETLYQNLFVLPFGITIPTSWYLWAGYVHPDQTLNRDIKNKTRSSCNILW